MLAECDILCFYTVSILCAAMSFRPPIPLTELHDIGVRQHSSDVVPLLWEIKRLHAIVGRVYQLEQSLGSHEGGTSVCLILRCLRDEIKDEPCLERHKKLVADIVNEKTSKRRE